MTTNQPSTVITGSWMENDPDSYTIEFYDRPGFRGNLVWTATQEDLREHTVGLFLLCKPVLWCKM